MTWPFLSIGCAAIYQQMAAVSSFFIAVFVRAGTRGRNAVCSHASEMCGSCGSSFARAAWFHAIPQKFNHLSINPEELTVLDSDDATNVRSSLTTIRVASVPSNHVYVRHLAPGPGGDLTGFANRTRIVRLADPDPKDPRRSAQSRWWPPVMLSAEWVESEHASFDVFHLQFGFDARTPAQLGMLVAALRKHGKPLVYTVHDLRNPHHPDRGEHDAQLDILITAADALITLTAGAASEIQLRWGRRALVLPHPHVVDFETISQLIDTRESAGHPPSAPGRRPFRVGVHVKSLRANMDPIPVIQQLTEISTDLPGSVVQVNSHHDVLDKTAPRYSRDLDLFLRDSGRRGLIDLRVHNYFSDAELWSYLASLDATVLPYRFGTHSGWLEAARDLGTHAIVPSCGYYREQGPALEFTFTETSFDTDSLRRATIAAAESSPSRVGIAVRREQREWLADQHSALYTELLS